MQSQDIQKSRKSPQKFYLMKDRMMAVLNWRKRDTIDDTFMAVPLSAKQTRLYQAYRKEGLTESDIFDKLFPTPRVTQPRTVSIDIGRLTKEQLVAMIEETLEIHTPSLTRMKKAELENLFLAVTTKVTWQSPS